MVNQGYIMLRALGGRRWDGGANLPQWGVTARVPSSCSWIAGASTVVLRAWREGTRGAIVTLEYRLEITRDVGSP